MLTMFDTDASLQDILFHELHHRFYNSLQFVLVCGRGAEQGTPVSA